MISGLKTLNDFVGLKSLDVNLNLNHSNENYLAFFSVVLLVLLCSDALTFESVDETLKCDHSNQSY